MNTHAHGPGALLVTLMATATLAAEVPTIDVWKPQQGGTSSGGGFTLIGDLLTEQVLTNEVRQLAFEPLYWTATVQPVLSIQSAPGSVVITWPSSLAHWELEVSTNLTSRPLYWEALRSPRQTNHSTVSVYVPVAASAQLYRLRRPGPDK